MNRLLNSLLLNRGFLTSSLSLGRQMLVFFFLMGAASSAMAEELSIDDEVVEIPLLVEALADDSFSVRQDATIELWSRGEAAIPALREATRGADPEMVDRAAELLLYISAGVLFDSPKEVKDLVLHYFAGGPDSKLRILKKLMELKQWKQVLHLGKLEKDPEARLKISETVRATAKRAAQEALLDGDLDLVGEILALGGDSDQSLVVRAWFVIHQGHLKEELAKAVAMPGDQGVKWSLALHRVSGDLEAAIRDAKKLNRSKLEASLQILTGDAKPWLKMSANNSKLHDTILNHSYQIQMERLAGETQQAATLVRELAGLAVNEETASRVISGLAGNGYQKEALNLLERYDVEAAFEYYENTESPSLALKMFDIPADAKPPYTKWVKTFTERVVAEEEEDLYDRLLMLAGFLVTHGEEEHVEAVLTPLMTALEADGSDYWFDLIGKMPIYGLAPQAVRFLELRGNEDREIELGVMNLLDSGRSVKHIWSALLKQNDQDATKSLHQIALLAGLLPDPKKETDAISQTLLDGVAGKLAADQALRQESLFAFAVKRHELAVASKMVDGFAEKDPKGRWTRTKLFLDAALLRWKRVEPVYAAQAEESPGDYFNLVKWAICLRKLGNHQKAQEVLDRALLLTMGDVVTVGSIGIQLAGAGYTSEAFTLLRQALMMADPKSEAFAQMVVFMVNYAKPDSSDQTWAGAAAVAEVYCRGTMQGRSARSVLNGLNARFQADFFRGMDHLEKGEKKQGMTLLDSCRKLNPGSGALADDFFPALRKVGIGKTYDRWFEESYAHVVAACDLYPKAHNTHNTAAWLASRAIRKLDEALVHAKTAIQLRPYQGAYLDTMAEVWFSKGDRKKAVKWSKKAITFSISHAQGNPRSESRVLSEYYELNKQLHRFETDPLPKAN